MTVGQSAQERDTLRDALDTRANAPNAPGAALPLLLASALVGEHSAGDGEKLILDYVSIWLVVIAKDCDRYAVSSQVGDRRSCEVPAWTASAMAIT